MIKQCQSRFGLLLACALLIPAFSCKVENQQSVVVLANLIPDLDGECAVTPPAEGSMIVYRPTGILDISQRNNYYMFPLIENRLDNTEKESDQNKATIDTRNDSATFVTDYVRVEYEVTKGNLAAGQTLQPHTAYTQAVVEPNGRMANWVEIIPSEMCTAFTNMVTPSITIVARVTYYGHTLDQDPADPDANADERKKIMHSNTFPYPIIVCRPDPALCADPCNTSCGGEIAGGCLDYREERPIDPENPAVTEPCGTDGTAPVCNRGQDEVTQCAVGTGT